MCEKPSTVSQVLAAKYPASNESDYPYRKRDTILRKLDQQLSRYERAKDAPERSGFVWTKTAEEILNLGGSVFSATGSSAAPGSKASKSNGRLDNSPSKRESIS